MSDGGRAEFSDKDLEAVDRLSDGSASLEHGIRLLVEKHPITAFEAEHFGNMFLCMGARLRAAEELGSATSSSIIGPDDEQ